MNLTQIFIQKNHERDPFVIFNRVQLFYLFFLKNSCINFLHSSSRIPEIILVFG